MRLAPRSLFGRNVLLLLGLFMFGLVCGAVALRQWVQKPRITQLSQLIVSQIRLTQSGLESLPAERRATTRPWLNARSGGALLVPLAAADPPSGPVQMSLITRQFLADLSARLPSGASDVRWSPAQHGTLWVRLSIAGEAFWFSESGLQFEGELPAAGLVLVALTALLSVAGAALIQRRINRPLSRLVQAANELAKGEPAPRLSEQAPKEIATVARAFNQMSASLAQMDADRTVVLAGVSHDLRTPLTKMRLAIEMLKGGDEVLIGAMLRSAAEMDAIIDQFLDYARAGSGEEMRYADLNELIRECAGRQAAHGHVLPLCLQDLPELPLRVSSIRRAVGNLIENALRYGGPEVLIDSRLLQASARVSVLDRGPGISANEIETLKKPFARGSNSAGIAGSGLGLAIVERIVRAHGGCFALLPRDGGGLEARIDLPRPHGAGGTAHPGPF
jgi:two-component system, OmpR family, osmolarity sensor histidine kinase EnvZ